MNKTRTTEDVRKTHWEEIYKSKSLEESSWYQAVPETTLKLIQACDLDQDADIIDVGGGDSLLTDHLVERGYANVTVVDISNTALERAKKRLGTKAENILWLEADAAAFYPPKSYDLWHDRATFHFLTDEAQAIRYVQTAQCYLNKGGYLIIGTFSEEGPNICSGLPVKQYSEASLTERFKLYFDKIQCEYMDHITPSGKKQNFIFCLFKKV